MYRKPNYELKAKVIEKGLDVIQRQVSLSWYRYDLEQKALCYDGEILELSKPYTIEECEKIISLYDSEEMQEARRVNDASYHRTIRLKNRIKSMLSFNDCIFLTLTFTDDVLESTTKETRRRYVARFLKENTLSYVANIDYGKKNEREHYHAVVRANMINHSNWLYGAINFERVKVRQDCEIKLAKYVNKLTNHAIKETTQRNHLIFSRGE